MRDGMRKASALEVREDADTDTVPVPLVGPGGNQERRLPTRPGDFAILLHNCVHRSHAHGFFLPQLRISVFTIAQDWVNSW
jgi:hypothetical protein